MNTIYLTGGLVFVIAFLTVIVKGKFLPALGIATILGLVGCLCGAFLALIIGSFVPDKDVTYGPATLAAMRSADGVSGTFVWGTGAIGQSVTYNFYMRNDDGSLTPGQADADSTVRIIEDPSLTDVGYWKQIRREPDLDSPLVPFAFVVKQSVIIEQNFRVPRGTVVQNFSVK